MQVKKGDIIEDIVFMQNGNGGPDGVKDSNGDPIINFDNPILPVPTEKYGPVDAGNAAVVEGDNKGQGSWLFLIAIAAGIAYIANPKKASVSVPVVVLGGLGVMLLDRNKKASVITPVVETGLVS